MISLDDIGMSVTDQITTVLSKNGWWRDNRYTTYVLTNGSKVMNPMIIKHSVSPLTKDAILEFTRTADSWVEEFEDFD